MKFSNIILFGILLALAIVLAQGDDVFYSISTVMGPTVGGYSLYQPMGIVFTNDYYLITDTFNNNILKVLNNGTNSVVGGQYFKGFNGDGLDATSSYLNYPNEAQIDWNGNIVVADSENHKIRKISNGIMTTIAGTGYGASSGDGLLAIESHINYPVSIAISHSTREIYFTERDGHKVRKIAQDGTLVTIAGTGNAGYNGDNIPANQAQISGAYGIALDSNTGTMYIADMRNQRIRKVSNGIISTIAGNGNEGYYGDNGDATQASLNLPVGVNILSNGDVIFTEYISSVVRKVSKSTGIITTIAGIGYEGFNGDDNGLGTSTQLFNPCYAAVTQNNEIYIADRTNSRIRKLTPTCSNGLTLSSDGTSCNLACTWDDSSISAKTPTIESVIIDEGLKFTVGFSINSAVDYSHIMYIGESGFVASSCSIQGNSTSISLSQIPSVDCTKMYETQVLSIDDLVRNTNVKQELVGEYLKLTVPITLSYLDSTGSGNNGFCRGYTFFTTQTVYFKIVATAISNYQQDFNYIYSVKAYPQSFTANSDGTLSIGLIFESTNSSLNALSFHNSSNPSLELQVTSQSSLYTLQRANYYSISAKSLASVSDFRSTIFFKADLTYLFTKETVYNFVSVKIDYSIVIPPSDKNFTLQSSMSINDNTWTPKSTFKENERIYIQVATSTSIGDYHLKVNDAYLCCFKEFTSTPTYDPSQGQYACSKYDSNTMSAWKSLVSNGAVDQLETILYPYTQVKSLYGFSFKLDEALFPDRIPQTCYVQANVGIVSTTSSRRMISEQAEISSLSESNVSPHTISMFVVQIEETGTKVSNASRMTISFIVFTLAMMAFMIL